MQNLSHKLKESIASTLEQSKMAFACDIDRHACEPQESGILPGGF